MIPVRDAYTIGPREAWEIVRSINPRIVIPMHYSNPKCSFLKYLVDDFADARGNFLMRLKAHTAAVEEIPVKNMPVILILDSAR